MRNLMWLLVLVCAFVCGGSIGAQHFTSVSGQYSPSDEPTASVLSLTSDHGGEPSAQQAAKPTPVWQLVKVDCKQASLRGLHVLDSNHIFASGSKGMVVHSVDGGTNWNVQSVLERRTSIFVTSTRSMRTTC